MAFPDVPEHLQQRDLREPDLADIRRALLLAYGWMHLSRTADNRILELFRQGKIKGTVTGAQGNEALATAVALSLDKAIDVVSWTHRDLPGHLIWSGHLVEHLCQYLANSGSPTFAREGNVHHGDPANRSFPMISHLGAMLSNVLGGADSQRRQGRPAVGVAIFGDGGSSTGDIHESMNLASVLGLPVLFLIENNQYAYSTPTAQQFRGDALYKRAAGYGMEGRRIDATDPETTLREITAAVARVRETGRPMLIEARTLRLRGHAAYDTCDYLPEGMQAAWEKQDPLPRLRARLAEDGLADSLETIETANKAFFEACLGEALKFPPPAPAVLTDKVFSPRRLEPDWQPGPMPERLTFAQALQRAHRKILSERPESLVMGQDIADYGGAFKVTEGLLKEFGRDRVLNTPLAESATTGYAIGLALTGHRPIVEFQFADFATDATTQIILNAATYHFRSGAEVPLVLRLPCGGGLTFGSFHSQDLESLYAHAPGLKILYPSTPQDAFNALLAAYEDNNPVLLFEHKRLYRLHRAEVAFDPNYRSIWRPHKVRSGTHGTIIAYGEMLLLAVEAADYLAVEYGYTFDVFDLRALAPLQLDEIQASLAATHRLCVVHEGRTTCGFGAELIARLTGQHFHDMDAAPLRIASADTPVPFAPELEQVYRPSRDSIIEALIDWFE
ncbi:MAG: transketolase [Verrucomicrobia bacterium]|nr:MAG: transketolase [Verrucomicrobiota bacterium]